MQWQWRMLGIWGLREPMPQRLGCRQLHKGRSSRDFGGFQDPRPAETGWVFCEQRRWPNQRVKETHPQPQGLVRLVGSSMNCICKGSAVYRTPRAELVCRDSGAFDWKITWSWSSIELGSFQLFWNDFGLILLTSDENEFGQIPKLATWKVLNIQAQELTNSLSMNRSKRTLLEVCRPKKEPTQTRSFVY